MGILSGIRVIDCGTYIAAPAAAAVMSDFGAEVIKIERPPHGDPHRCLPLVPGLPSCEHNYCWILDGRNKRSLALNLADAAGRDVLLKLVAAADVFITNYQPALAAKFRLRYEDLSPVNERLIYAYVTGYGERGDGAGAPGYDATAYWARSGLMGTIHNADSEPAISPPGFGDHPTAMALFGGIMLALYERLRTGRGMKVSTSLMANGAWSNACHIQAELCGATFVPRWTRRTTVNPLVNHYVSRDGMRFFFCLLDPAKDWANFCHALDRAMLIEDPRFATPQLRRLNGPALVDLIDDAMAGKDAAEWKRIFAAHEVIWGPVPKFGDAAYDEQMRANGVFMPIEGTPLETVNSPVEIAGVEKAKARLAPEIGEHTREILGELGFGEDEIRALRERNVII
jgi:crotonobetainyl-CoA:carnitine CoA-transferase CaiB-like acyl-CoA transferase